MYSFCIVFTSQLILCSKQYLSFNWQKYHSTNAIFKYHPRFLNAAVSHLPSVFIYTDTTTISSLHHRFANEPHANQQFCTLSTPPIAHIWERPPDSPSAILKQFVHYSTITHTTAISLHPRFANDSRTNQGFCTLSTPPIAHIWERPPDSPLLS
jgi:hypothetical protein